MTSDLAVSAAQPMGDNWLTLQLQPPQASGDSTGQTPLHLAAQGGLKQLCLLALTWVFSLMPLLGAWRHGQQHRACQEVLGQRLKDKNYVLQVMEKNLAASPLTTDGSWWCHHFALARPAARPQTRKHR